MVQSKKSLLYSICFMLFIDSMAQGLTFPILPELFLNSQFGLVTDDLYVSKELLISMTFALFPLSSMFGMPILGLISDKYGRKIVILYGLSGLILSELMNIIAILTHTTWLFLLCIILSGFLSGIYAVGDALISDISDSDEQRVSNFKLPVVASLLGFISGPALSIFVGNIAIVNPLVTPFIIALALSIINFALLWCNLNNYIIKNVIDKCIKSNTCLLYTSPSPRDRTRSRMPSSA